ncbi:MAG: hypothetical protein IJV89_10125 [Lentisphaeria bacterium]|nr:hypothetical protein [Lentisphaeria bacterium]
MCIWAAYAGPRNAAEVVRKMIWRSYGIWGGYFSGMASCDSGKLCYGKTAGDNTVWDAKFKVEDFPGNVALFHSRTPSEDDSEWAHPFGTDVVQVANQGCFGVFSQAAANYSKLAAEMLGAGYTCRSATTRHMEWAWQPKLPDGRPVHGNEIVAYAADKIYRETGDAIKAVRGSFGRCPGEAVGLAIFAGEPETIYIANMNQRVVLAHEEGGLALSTVRVSFSNPAAGDMMEIPCNTLAAVHGDGRVEMQEFIPGQTICREVPANFREEAIKWWTGKKDTVIDTYWSEFLSKFWPEVPEVPDTRAILAYRVLDELLITGKLVQDVREVKGLLTPDRCSRTFFNWVD